MLSQCTFHQVTFDGFNSFIINLEKLVVNISGTNPHFVLMIGDFNANSSNWSSTDTNEVVCAFISKNLCLQAVYLIRT